MNPRKNFPSGPTRGSVGTQGLVADNERRLPPRPERILLLSLTGWLSIFLISGFSYSYTISPEAWVWMLAASLAFVIGALFVKILVRPGELITRPSRFDTYAGARSLLRITFLLTVLSLIFQVASGSIDLSFSSSESIAENRELKTIEEGFSLSELGTPLSAFGVIAAIIIGYIPRQRLGSTLFWLGVSTTIIFNLIWIARGSRTTTVYLIVAMVISYLARPRRKRISFGLLAGIAAAAIAIFVLSVWILEGRTQNHGRNAIDAIVYLTEAHSVRFPDWVTGLISSGSEEIAYTFVSIIHYFVHGVFEYGYLFTWREAVGAPLGLGQVSLSPLPQMTYPLAGLDLQSFSDLSPRFGVYQGLFGSLLIDFGPLGMVLAFLLLGLVAGAVHKRLLSSRSSLSLVILYVPLSVVAISAPFFNSLSGGNGIYVLIAAALSIFWITRRRFLIHE